MNALQSKAFHRVVLSSRSPAASTFRRRPRWLKKAGDGSGDGWRRLETAGDGWRRLDMGRVGPGWSGLVRVGHGCRRASATDLLDSRSSKKYKIRVWRGSRRASPKLVLASPTRGEARGEAHRPTARLADARRGSRRGSPLFWVAGQPLAAVSGRTILALHGVVSGLTRSFFFKYLASLTLR